MVRLAVQLTRKVTSEVATFTIGFVDDDGKETRVVVEAIVWEKPKMGFFLGLPDILRNFLDIFVNMLIDAEQTLEEVNISMALTEEQLAGTSNPISSEVKDGVGIDMKEKGVRLWSNWQSTEAPVELETPEPLHFGPVL